MGGKGKGKGEVHDLREKLDGRAKGKGKPTGDGDLRDKLDGMRGRGGGGGVTGDGRGRGGGGGSITGDGRGRGGSSGGHRTDGRGRGGGSSELWRPPPAATGEPFSEPVTFAGRVDEFVICGNETFVSSSRYAHLKSQIGVGVVLTGVREANSRGKSKWVAVSISSATQGSSGEPFSELVSYAGRSAQFVVAGDTFVPVSAYAKFLPVYDGDRLSGRRVPDTHGNKRWRAISVDEVTRAAGAAVSGQEGWIQRSHELLTAIANESDDVGGLSPLAAATPTGARGVTGAPADSEEQEEQEEQEEVLEDVVREALELLELAERQTQWPAERSGHRG